MTYIQSLRTIRDDAAETLATAMTAQKTNPVPSHSVGGRAFSWTEYYAFLRQALSDANQDLINASGAVETRTIVLG